MLQAVLDKITLVAGRTEGDASDRGPSLPPAGLAPCPELAGADMGVVQEEAVFSPRLCPEARKTKTDLVVTPSGPKSDMRPEKMM